MAFVFWTIFTQKQQTHKFSATLLPKSWKRNDLMELSLENFTGPTVWQLQNAGGYHKLFTNFSMIVRDFPLSLSSILTFGRKEVTN